MLPLPAGLPFPSDRQSESKKLDPVKFGLPCAQALYSRWYNNGSGYDFGGDWGYGSVKELSLIELYGKSKQPNEKYKDWFTNFKQTGARGQGGTRVDGHMGLAMGRADRVAHANIDYSVVSPVEKLASIIISILSEDQYKAECISTDQTVIDEKTRLKFEELYANKLTNPLAKKLGLPEIPLKDAPDTEEEADLQERSGKYKQKIEVAFETLAKHGFRVSNWKDEKRYLNRNAINFHMRCVKLYNDYTNCGVIKAKYIDVKKLIMLWNPDNRYEPVAIGHMEMQDVQYIYPFLAEAGYTDAQIAAMAKSYMAYQSSTVRVTDWMWDKVDPVTKQWLWMDFKIPTMPFEYLSTDYKQYVKGTDKKGKTFYNKNEEPVPDKEKSKDREYDDFKCNTWYRGVYLCGTNMIYGWEKMPNQMQKNKLNPVSSYVFDRIEGLAPTQRVISLCDDLMYGVLKLRAAVWAAAPKGFRIDIGMGGNIKIGDQEYSIFDLIHLWRQNGIQITATKFHAATGKAMSMPLEEIQGGLGPQGQEWKEFCDGKINEILDMMGIPGIMAAQPDPSGEKAVGVAEAEFVSGNNALYPLKESQILFEERVAERFILMTRMDIKYDPEIRKYYEGALGKDLIDVLDQVKDMTMSQLGITMRALPNQKRKDFMMQRLTELAKMGTRDGIMIVTPSELETFEDLLTNDQIEEAKWYLAKCEEKAMARAEKNRTQATQEQGQVSIASTQAAEAAKQQTNALATEGDIARIRAQGEEDRLTQREKYDFENSLKQALQAQKSDLNQEEMVTEATLQEVSGTNINNEK